jgi:hypothetical protein
VKKALHYLLSFACAIVAAALTVAALVLKDEATPTLLGFTLLFTSAAALLVAAPIVVFLHLLRRTSLTSHLLGGLLCGAVLALWNAAHFVVVESERTLLPLVGLFSQSSAVILVASIVGALTYWYLAFRALK